MLSMLCDVYIVTDIHTARTITDLGIDIVLFCFAYIAVASC